MKVSGQLEVELSPGVDALRALEGLVEGADPGGVGPGAGARVH